MKLFKERMKTIGLNVAAFLIMLVVIFVPIGIIELTRFIWKPLPDVIYCILCVLMILFYVGYAINWLIIEPIRSHKREKQELSSEEEDKEEL